MKPIFLLATAAALVSSVPVAANVFHVVTFRYKAGVTDAQRQTFSRRIRNLATTALRYGKPYIVSIRGGPPISSEGFDQGFEQMFIIEFRSRSDRNYFIGPPYVSAPDPIHHKVIEAVLPNVERNAAGKLTGSFVFDFEDDTK